MKSTTLNRTRAALAVSVAALVFSCGAPLMAQDSNVVDEGTKAERRERPEGKERQRRVSKEALEKYDKDGDGKLSEEERTAFRDDRRKKMLEQFDTNNDGKLDDAERAKAREARGGNREGGRRQLSPEQLKQFDKDGDGKLSEEERGAMREDRKKRFMEKFDTNKDGELDDAEKASIRRMHGGDGQRKGPRGERGDKPAAEESDE